VFQDATKWVLLCADSPCSIRFGTGTFAATTANFRLPGNVPLPFRVPAAGAYKVSAITNP
jgi:hypothetical protein